MTGFDILRYRLMAVFMETAIGVLSWRRPDPTATPSRWRVAVVSACVRISASLGGIR